MENKVSIALVDDHTIVREGMKALIHSMGNYDVTREYGDGKYLIEDFTRNNEPCVADIVIMDLEMPGMGGEETMRWMQQNAPDQKVLILTWDASEEKVISLFKMGVRGYLLKSSSADTLRTALEDTATEGYYHSELLQSAMQKSTTAKEDKEHLVMSVSERELYFLQLVCDKEEYTYDVIADIMQVSRRTVDGYRESLFNKFQIKSKTGLVMYAIKHRLIDM